MTRHDSTHKIGSQEDPHAERFLATTALEEFWDTSGPILFLGEWCRRYSRRHVWKSLDAQVLPSSWADTAEWLTATQHLDRFFERTIVGLSAALNEIHHTNHSERYWRILIGPWLQRYLYMLFDRYVLIRSVLEVPTTLSTIGLERESFVCPVDTMDFAQRALDDPYNLQMFTRILEWFGFEFCRRSPLQQPVTGITGAPPPAKPLSSLGRKAVGALVRIHGGRVILHRQSYFSRRAQISLLAASAGRFIPIPAFQYTASTVTSVKPEMRLKVHDLDLGEGDFIDLVSTMIPGDVPMTFIEGYRELAEQVQRMCRLRPTHIMSANAWYFDEPFKLWAAEDAEQGTILLGSQHGGNYGVTRIVAGETLERSLVDRYYSWGWVVDDDSRVVPMPAPKLVGRRKLEGEAEAEGILLMGTALPRIGGSTQAISRRFSELLRFPSALPKALRCHLRFRPHVNDYGWDIRARWSDQYPDIPVEDWTVGFDTSLTRCRLYVCSHLSTTYAEALALNKPTILFWREDYPPIRPAAQEVFDGLREVGILHESPEAAAAAVAEVYACAQDWWNESERQAAVSRFRDRYARTSDDAIAEWAAEFKRLLSKRRNS